MAYSPAVWSDIPPAAMILWQTATGAGNHSLGEAVKAGAVLVSYGAELLPTGALPATPASAAAAPLTRQAGLDALKQLAEATPAQATALAGFPWLLLLPVILDIIKKLLSS